MAKKTYFPTESKRLSSSLNIIEANQTLKQLPH